MDTLTSPRDLEKDVDEVVSYHAPDAAGIERISNIRSATKRMILAILENCPHGPDRSAAIRKARETMMTANAAIVVPFVQF